MLSCMTTRVHVSYVAVEEVVLMDYAQRKYVSLVNDGGVLSDTPMTFQLVRPGLTNVNNSVSFKSSERPGWYLRHKMGRIILAKSTDGSSFPKDATFIEHPDSFYPGFTSFESFNYPGHFIWTNDQLQLRNQKFEVTPAYKAAASFKNGRPTFCLVVIRKSFNETLQVPIS